MTTFIKQSTASQNIIIGPFVDDTDYKTPETSLTIANTDIKLCKSGTTAVDKNSGGATHRVNGMYVITLDDTDTSTVGELHISVLVSGALLVTKTCFVLEENIFNAMFAQNSAAFDSNQRVDISKIEGTDATDQLSASNVGVLTTALTESYSTDGSAATAAQILYELRSFLFEQSKSGVTVTTKRLDGTTTAMTLTLDDADTPTSITRAS